MSRSPDKNLLIFSSRVLACLVFTELNCMICCVAAPLFEIISNRKKLSSFVNPLSLISTYFRSSLKECMRLSFFNMRCLRSPVAILTAFFFRQNPILSLISCVSRRGRRLELSYLGWMVSKSLKASSGLSVRMADSYFERILSTV